jgi:hypothetical protein
MSYLIDVDKIDQTENAYLSPLNGQTECVAMVQAAPPAIGSSNPPNTKTWRPGLWVHGAQQGAIKKGTVIATFLLDKYPLTSPRHAAVYLSHDEKGISVIDQWKGATGSTPGNHRPLRFQGIENRSVDNGDLYYVVELTTMPGQPGPSGTDGSTGVDQQTLQ